MRHPLGTYNGRSYAPTIGGMARFLNTVRTFPDGCANHRRLGFEERGRVRRFAR